jgi:hypothetical protein
MFFCGGGSGLCCCRLPLRMPRGCSVPVLCSVWRVRSQTAALKQRAALCSSSWQRAGGPLLAPLLLAASF